MITAKGYMGIIVQASGLARYLVVSHDLLTGHFLHTKMRFEIFGHNPDPL